MRQYTARGHGEVWFGRYGTVRGTTDDAAENDF
jgi:hypothetical protein